MTNCLNCHKSKLEQGDMWGGNLNDLCGCCRHDFKPAPATTMVSTPTVLLLFGQPVPLTLQVVDNLEDHIQKLISNAINRPRPRIFKDH